MRKLKGFTLLELLVVIGIIGILVALGTVAYSSAQRSGRDTRRKQDMIAVQNALEQYYSENDYAYPTTCSDAQTYMKSAWPADPDPTVLYTYGCTSATTYCVCATMEGTGGNSSAADCSWTNGGGYYCVGNLQ